jgi:hypothetical protein
MKPISPATPAPQALGPTRQHPALPIARPSRSTTKSAEAAGSSRTIPSSQRRVCATSTCGRLSQ